MDDYISREAATKQLYTLPCKMDEDGYRWVLSRDVAKMIDEIPAADVRPVVRGWWALSTAHFSPEIVCSACRAEYPLIAGATQNRLNFCPNCGADMREETNG